MAYVRTAGKFLCNYTLIKYLRLPYPGGGREDVPERVEMRWIKGRGHRKGQSSSYGD